MSLPDDCLKLIKILVKTRSCYKIQRLVLEFLLANKEAFSKDQEIDILNFLKANSIEQAEAGKEAIKKRKYENKLKKTTYKQPVFVDNYTAKYNCKTCNEPIDASCAFRWMKEGEYNDYHSLPECFPKDHYKLFEGNLKFNKWKFGLK